MGKRDNRWPVALSTEFSLAINKIAGKLDISFANAVELAINGGLWYYREFTEYNQDTFELFEKWYKRTQLEVREDNLREWLRNSHLPVIQKARRKFVENTQEEGLKTRHMSQDRIDKQLKGILEDWDYPRENIKEWREKAFAFAEKYADKLQSAREVLALKEAS